MRFKARAVLTDDDLMDDERAIPMLTRFALLMSAMIVPAPVATVAMLVGRSLLS
jgi:hypothetical protein